ncbi:GntR family transcriptional regulator [Halomonas denitrificans]|uniref:GntR family transcriptional regulator n=1 Tax=Halomonas TaxID=2745 RepID=UPI001C95F8D7|nr:MULTISPECIES: GntR family transcriptional regulator [Halomonas]MED5297187.1 GntR family transcriptional regulator [Pseudomonadota bacterium]MBY5985828.1 GntR family transcriptional regulator [Halomonas sp. DP5Y7-2]MBY6028038.1 GntR family transcriptional regulator [Halomonas sp. DP8Y7-1]MCA0976604.1 GntR family transcriptional regulator [Halomonas denitrificans]MEE3215891.1 GntR family transcriptional regulator [Pseudomonadota bacterium]
MQDFERPPSLGTLVTDHVRSMIVRGELALGEAISERGISALLNVSKTPVREALTRLKHEGLVTIVPQSGARVFTLSAREVGNICTFRRTLEPAALELAIAFDHAGLSQRLRQIESQMQVAHGSGKIVEYLDLDTDFHLTFFHHCGNPYLQSSYEQYSGKISALRTHLATRPDHTRLSLKEHSEIVDAVMNKDIAALRQLLDAHIDRTQHTYEIGVEDISTQ